LLALVRVVAGVPPVTVENRIRMAPKHHPAPLSGGDRKALAKELGKARAMTNILAAQSAEMRAKAETLLRKLERAHVGRRPPATLLQLGRQPRHPRIDP
jgi:hypothetical protein